LRAQRTRGKRSSRCDCEFCGKASGFLTACQSLIHLYHLMEYYPSEMAARSTVEKLVQRLQVLNADEMTATVRTLDDATKPALPHCLAAIKAQVQKP
jgi:hypothetical protein